MTSDLQTSCAAQERKIIITSHDIRTDFVLDCGDLDLLQPCEDRLPWWVVLSRWGEWPSVLDSTNGNKFRF